MELLISAGLFLIILSFASGIYVSITRASRQNYSAQKIYTESRFLLNLLISDITSNYIYYKSNYPLDSPQTVLGLRNEQGEAIVYWVDNGDLKRRIGLEQPVSLTSKFIEITRLNYYITPYIQNRTGKDVPLVLISWQAKERDNSSSPIIDLQTSVSLRNF